MNIATTFAKTHINNEAYLVADSPRILLYDIETSPNLSYTWAMYEQNVIAFEKQWELLTVAYKWLGEPKIHCVSRRTKSEKEIVLAVHDLFEEADFLVGHNGDEFDYKKMNAKFIEHGLIPPSPSTCIDTKKLAKRYFKFNSNKLDDLCEILKIGKKMNTGGFDLWLGCMRGDKKSFLKMEEYNTQDVKILEKLYLKLRPWIKRQPGISIASSRLQCANCDSFKVHKRGYETVGGVKRQRFNCRDCGAWSRGGVFREVGKL